MAPKHMFMLIVAGIAAIIVVNATFIVRETEQAMVLRFGQVDHVLLIRGMSILLLCSILRIKRCVLQAADLSLGQTGRSANNQFTGNLDFLGRAFRIADLA